MFTPQRLLIGLVGLVVVVLATGIGFALLLGGGDPGTAASPSPTQSNGQGAEEPGEPSAGPSASEDDALAILEEIEEQVIAIRGLESADIGPPELLTREELRAELQELFDEDYPADERERDNIVLRALGLLEPDQDVAELQLELLGDQVLGFYDDVDKRMVVVTESGLDAEARLTYAHEYTHALQDAAFGLDSLETDAVGEDDRSLARTALIEGDATVTMLAWAFAHLTQEELMGLSQTPIPDTGDAPNWMIATLTFPYERGLTWASVLAGSQPTAPDFDEIDAAYADPPDSTEQIIDVDAWYADEEPISVEVGDLAGAMGPDWEEVETTTIGEASIGIMLEYFGASRADARAAADGWGGDRAVIVSGPDDAFAVAWRLAWDSSADGEEFLAAYDSIISGLGFPAVVQEADGEVLVVHGSDVDVLRRAVSAAGG